MKRLFAFLTLATLALLQSCSPKHHSDSAEAAMPEMKIDSNLVIPPAWAFGVLYGGYTNQKQTIQRIKDIKAHNYPIDAYWIDSWFWSFDNHGKGPKKYIDFVADTTAFPNRKAMWDFMQKNDIKGGFWIWDCIQKTGNEAAFNDFEKRGYFSKVFINTDTWHNAGTTTAMFNTTKSKVATPTGNIDFDNPKAVAYFQKRMKHFFDEGADFIKLDRTSKISVCKAMFEMTQKYGKETEGRGFILSHTGGTDSPTYERYPTKWTDDTRSDWTLEKPTKEFNSWVPRVAFKENIAMYTDTSKATSKIPFLTNDTGGFDMGKTDKLDKELYIRWMEFSMFCPITEVFSQPENPTSNLAYLYSEQADALFRNYAHQRMELFPYIYTYALRSRLQSQHMIGKIPGHLYEYLFGNEMLVAPVYVQGAVSRKVFFPEGTWIDKVTGEKYKGNQEVEVPAPLEKIPVFVKEGAIIPSRNYAPTIESGSNDTLTVDIYPSSEESGFTMYEDDGRSNGYQNGEIASTNFSTSRSDDRINFAISPVAGNYKGMKPDRYWRLVFHAVSQPRAVFVNGKDATGWIYDYENKTITIRLKSVKSTENQVNIEL